MIGRAKKGMCVLVVLLLLVAGITTTFAAGGKESGGVKGTVTFWHQANVANPTDPNVVWQQGNFDSFKAKYPGITVERTIVSGGDEYLNKITTSMAAGNAPDIFQTWLSGRLEPFVTAGRVIPLDDVINGDPALKDVITPAFLDTGTFNGKVYALATTLTAEVIFYNKAIFAKYGLSVPATFDDLMTVITTLKKNGIVPFAMGNKDPWVGCIPFMAIFDRVAGLQLYKDICLSHISKWNDPAFIESSKYLLKMRDAGAYPENFNSLDYNEAVQMFKDGKAAMWFNGTWEMANLLQGVPDKDLGFFNFPNISGGKGTSKSFLLNKDEGYAISSSAKNRDGAVLYLKQLFSKERQKVRAEQGTLVATRNLGYDETKLPRITVELTKAMAGAAYGVIPWDNPLGVNMGKEINLSTQAVLAGQDPADVFAKLQAVSMNEWGK
jgi:raffinose/stachyose/melibiose transport system substrate-binding protein